MVSAIQTSYAGCRFRSRLEARYAVLFDQLSIDWRYEHEGYIVGPLHDQLPYLPDFWLPDHAAWVEIKGAEPDDHEVTKLTELARAVSPAGHRAHMLIGDIPRSATISGGHPVIPAMTPVPIWAVDESDRIYTMPAQEWASAAPEDWILLDGTWRPGRTEEQLNRALTAARSARFEHGQHGA